MNHQEAEELYNEWKYMNWTSELVEDIQLEWESAVLELHKEKVGTRKRKFDTAYASLISKGFKDEVEELQSGFQAQVSERYDGLKEDRDNVEAQLKLFSKTYEPIESDWTILTSCDGGRYHTQGFGANKYAKNSLLSDLVLLQTLGYSAEIRNGKSRRVSRMHGETYYTNYELWAKISDFDFQMIKWSSKFVSVLNWATLCWRNSVNPKVYFPFLSYDDYEKSQALYRLKNYEINRENMGLEPSWDEIEKLKKEYEAE